MEYKQYSLGGCKINIVIDDISNLRLLQASSKYPLSQYFYKGKKPRAIINCSYFTNTYVIGRNQGDLSQNTSSFTDKGWLGFALKDDLTYQSGELNWWDVDKSVCGFTPALICVKDGKRVEMNTKELASTYAYKIGLATGVTFFGIQKDRRTCMFVTVQKGLSGTKVLDYLVTFFDFDFLCELDGGGSTEMIVDGAIKQKSTDGSERYMFNGLAFIQPEEKQEDLDLLFPCKDGWGSQAFTKTHFGIDIGWLSKFSTDGRTSVLACADGEVVHEGVYPQVINGKSYKPIGVIIKHNLSDLYDYYSIYWHLGETCVNKGMTVLKGQRIGTRGNTGYCANGSVHLHFQLLKLKKGATLPSYTGWDKCSIDPVPFISVDDTQEFFYDNTCAFDLRHVKNVSNEANNNTNVDNNDVVEALKKEIADKDKTIATLKDMNKSLDEANKILQNKLDKIKEIL